MRKFFTLFAALVCGMTMSAKTLYCKMESSWWTQDGAAISAYAWGTDGANAGWPGVRMTAVEGHANLWQTDIDVTKYNKIIFVRVNPSGDVTDWGAKTQDLDIPTDGKNLFTITNTTDTWGDPGCSGVWSVYNGQGGGGDPVTPQPGGGQHDYYLMGNLTGAQGGDITVPTAEELFEGGMLTYTFPGDPNNGGRGYFFVMVCDPGQVIGVGYMLKAYSQESHGTLFSQSEHGDANQKLGVPGPTVTFYLYDNGDGTLELSTVQLPGKTLVGGGQGVENTFVNEKAHKTIVDGQLRIIRGDKIFDATGRQIQ